jgi:hypothetical protein
MLTVVNSLDAPQKVARGPVWRARKIDGEDWPIVIFRFLYRSEGIYFPALPPSPSRPKRNKKQTNNPSSQPHSKTSASSIALHRPRHPHLHLALHPPPP